MRNLSLFLFVLPVFNLYAASDAVPEAVAPRENVPLALSPSLLAQPAFNFEDVSAPTPESVMRHARNGRAQLALSKVLEAQAANPDRAQWLTWEALRWDLLLQLKRWTELVERTGSVAADAPDAMRSRALWLGARANVALHHNPEARNGLARLLWQDGLDAAQTREARRLVIETYFSQERVEDTYLAILRFQQDYRPLSRTEASGFVQGLAAHGKAVEALAWLPQIGEGPLAQLVRMRAEVIKPASAGEQARDALRKSGNAGYWAVLGYAAAMQQETGVRVEAQEQLLAAQDESVPALLRTTPAELWRSYSAHALSVGNQHQLLQGDDGAWMALASRLGQENPLAARSLLGHLAQQAKDKTLREQAEVLLGRQLMLAGLSQTAHFLFPKKADLVTELLDDMARLQDTALRQAALLQLASLSQMRGEHARAAEFLLHLAGDEANPPARQLRWQAAENLALAGFGEDARNQYQLLLETETDPALRGLLRMKLGLRP